VEADTAGSGLLYRCGCGRVGGCMPRAACCFQHCVD
jgi:hypothetical protein